MSMAPTKRPMPNVPPFLPLNTFLMRNNNASKPPYSSISAQMAATKIATMDVSNIPEAPVPIFASNLVASVAPVASIIMEPLTIPIISTTNTLIPTMPPKSTST